MAGMKTRLTRIRTNAPGTAKRTLLFLLAFAVPGFTSAQDKPAISRVDRPSTLSPISKAANAGDTVKELSGAAAKKGLPIGIIKDLKITPEAGKVTVTVATNHLLAPQEFILENSNRLVLDFPDTENQVLAARFPVNAASVKQIKVSQFQSSPSPIARMVFDLDANPGSHEMTIDKSSISLVFHQGQNKPNPPGAGLGAKSVASPAPSVSALKTPEVRPNRAPVAEPAKAAAFDLKVRSAEPTKVTLPAVLPAAAPAKREVKAIVPAINPVPGPAEPPAKNIPAPVPVAVAVQPDAIRTPVVAAFNPASIAGPKMIQTATGRFSGQPLTLDFVDTPLVDFFRLLAEEGGINIVLDPSVKGTITIKVVKLPWDQIFEIALTNNGLDKQVEGSMIRVARKATLQDEAKQQESLNKANLLAADVETRIKRLNYAKASTMIAAIADLKTVRGTVVVDERTNSLILTDLPGSINKQIKLIETLDMPQPQVEIEARIVSGTRDFARDIGIQFGFVDGNLQRVTAGGPNTFGTIGGTRPSATPNSTFAAGNTDTGRGSSSDSSGTSGAVSTGSAGNYNVNLPAARAFGGLGVSIGNIFDTFLLDAAITAGESKGWAKLISQPRVTAQNNTPAEITQGLRFPVPVNANNTVTIQFFNAALKLTVTPQITYEGNIVLDLKVENNTPDFGRQVMQVPSIRTSESSTRVLVSDGGTTVIGGILMDDESNAEDKVPGLGSLPIIGNLFKRNTVSRNTQEVLFFVTPRIVK
jgi:type IV pilus secretin PilQ/predicted competence protein